MHILMPRTHPTIPSKAVALTLLITYLCLLLRLRSHCSVLSYPLFIQARTSANPMLECCAWLRRLSGTVACSLQFSHFSCLEIARTRCIADRISPFLFRPPHLDHAVPTEIGNDAVAQPTARRRIRDPDSCPGPTHPNADADADAACQACMRHGAQCGSNPFCPCSTAARQPGSTFRWPGTRRNDAARPSRLASSHTIPPACLHAHPTASPSYSTVHASMLSMAK